MHYEKLNRLFFAIRLSRNSKNVFRGANQGNALNRFGSLVLYFYFKIRLLWRSNTIKTSSVFRMKSIPICSCISILKNRTTVFL